jgi:hypothetical protein
MKPRWLAYQAFCLLAWSVLLGPLSLHAQWLQVDLVPYANSKLRNTQWWTGQAQAGLVDFDELLKVAEGKVHEFEGLGNKPIPFKIEDANLRIHGTNAAGNPEKITGIKVGATAKAIYFLHMTGWEAVGVPSYKFVMHYQGGASEELEAESNVNSDNWDQVPAPLADKNSAWVWQEAATTVARGGMIATKWDNPRATTRIETIDFVSLKTAAVPALFAITLGEASASVSPGDKAAVTWAQTKRVHSPM